MAWFSECVKAKIRCIYSLNIQNVLNAKRIIYNVHLAPTPTDNVRTSIANFKRLNLTSTKQETISIKSL